MVIIETPTFSNRIGKYLNDEEYRDLQNLLVAQPEKGDLVQHGQGLRKIRFSVGNLGKSKALRVLYYYHEEKQQILMLFVFAKSEASDLTQDQKKALGKIIKENYR